MHEYIRTRRPLSLLTAEEWREFDEAAFKGFFYATELQNRVVKLQEETCWDRMFLETKTQDLVTIVGTPLPVISTTFALNERYISVSRYVRKKWGAPMDTAIAEATGRRVGEAVMRQVGRSDKPVLCFQEPVLIRCQLDLGEEVVNGLKLVCCYILEPQ